MIPIVFAQMRAHWARFIAIGLGIALAAGFVSSTLIINSSLKSSLRESLGESFARSDLVVTGTGGAPISGEEISNLITPMNDVSGVASTAVNAETFTTGNGKTFSESYFLLNAAPEDPELDSFRMSSGERPASENDIVMDERTAKTLNIRLGDEIRMTIAQVPVEIDDDESLPVYRNSSESTRTFTVTGLARVPTDPLLVGQPRAIVSSASFQEYFAQISNVNSIQVATEEGADPAQVITDLNRIISDTELDGSLTAMTVDEAVDAKVRDLSNQNDTLTWILLVFAGISVVVALLVVSNTFSVIIAGRRRELALLRCLGASKAQLYQSVLIEGVFIGLIGSIIGVLGAIGFCQALGALVARTWPDDFSYVTVSVPAQALFAGVGIGLLLTLIATITPARGAVSVTPLEALAPVDEPATVPGQWRLRSIAGVVCLVIGVGLIVAALIFVSSSVAWVGVGAIGGALIVFGMFLCSIAIIPPVVGAVGNLFIKPFGIAGQMATLNTLRNRRRTASTATALIIGVTLVSTFMVGGSSTKATTAFGLGQHYPIDLSVPLEMTVDEATLDKVRAIDGVEAVVVAHRAELVESDLSETPQVFILDPEYAQWVLHEAAPELVQGRVIVPADYKHDTVKIKGLTTKNVPVVKSGESKRAFFTTPDVGNDLGVSATATEVLIKINEDTEVDDIFRIQQDVAVALDVTNETIGGSAIDRGVYSQIIDVLLYLAIGLLVVAVIIALIGISNTMSLSVIERQRENALLRALGLSLAQLRGMLAAEAVLISTVAALIGIGLGTILGVVGTRLITIEYSSNLVVQWPILSHLLILAVSAVSGVLSSLAPAHRAAKLSPVEGLGKEG